ncbi:MAG: polymerase [Treponema sp.]|jgi:hypothetical protein|nr:polymerase [Treponema sp.]
MKKLISFILIFPVCAAVFADTPYNDILREKIDISGIVEWDTFSISADISLDMASAGIKLPSGRTQGELLLAAGYLKLIQPGILNLQFDSSSTIGDLVERGEFSLPETDTFALKAQSLPPSLSPDLRKMSSTYTLALSGLNAAFLRHKRPSPVLRILNPVSSARYTGIIIIADGELPVHGMKSKAMPVPCLFPKIWDSEMNLIYERNMLETQNSAAAHGSAMVRYSSSNSIFQRNPSGLTKELIAAVGEKPLRIFASGVFGSKPTDLIIDRSDALLIISSEENHRLLREGKVAIILNDLVLKNKFTGN